MAFLHFNLSVAKLGLKHFLRRLLLMTSFYLNFSLPREVGLSITKFIIFFIHAVSSCQYKWPDNQSLFHLNTPPICWRVLYASLLLSSSVECCCFIFTPHIHWIILLHHHQFQYVTNLLLTWVMFDYHREAHFWHKHFPQFKSDIALFLSIGKSSWKPSKQTK